MTDSNNINNCSQFNNDPKKCVDNKCWYYFKERKCGVNYMNKKDKKTVNKRLETMQKMSKKTKDLKQSKRKSLLRKKSKRRSLSRKKSKRRSLSRKKSKRRSLSKKK
jgi:hypothetical protein